MRAVKWPELATLLLWECGYRVKDLMPVPTYYRHRQKLLAVGVDIGTLPTRPRSRQCDLRDIFSEKRRVKFDREVRRRLLVPERPRSTK